MDGDGTYRWPDGETYEGEWWDGKRYGEGIATYAPGRNAAPFYDGNWEYDEPVEKYPMSWRHVNTHQLLAVSPTCTRSACQGHTDM